MSKPAFIEIDGKRYLWRELIEKRREQIQQQSRVAQLALFELREDHKPACEGSAALRYQEPSLLSLLAAPRP